MEEVIKVLFNYGVGYIIVFLFIYDWLTNRKITTQTLVAIKESNENISKFLVSIKEDNENLSKSLDLLQESMQNENKKTSEILKILKEKEKK
ncbi:MAG TPA: hypothetical protein IAB27_05160 [Candidatus Coprosoma intestinipullorum]|uniref:Uncharacterized protein n=1 Tax=Candidatus Coprosoma intestinipullorum TaxID=2840752 RepID=A0A9D1CYQ8_9FIRM|nr:hypothetical protein [Candidatus Coprosoma intestinipullorum]